MKTLRIRILLPIAVFLCVSGANPARAQAPLEPAQMSARTSFYLIWRGVPSPDVRKANSLLAFWDDPDFAPVRSAMASNLMGSPAEKSAKEKLTAEEIQEYAALLENSFTVGYLSEPVKRTVSNAGAAADSKPAWNGMFFVYDRAGKELLLSKAILRMRAGGKEVPLLSQVTIGGVQVLKAQGKNGVSYWAEDGKYAVSASERSVMEEVLGRLDGKVSGASSLAQSAAYQEAQGNLGSGLLEFFLRIPDLKNLAADSKAGNFQVRPLLDAARLDAVHSLSGHVTFEGAKTHVQAAILGDVAPGTPFDIWTAGQPSPASLAFVPVDAVSYTSAQLNLLGIYDTVKRVALAAFPQAQQGNADLMDAIAQQKLGMPVPEALGLLTGEFASMQTSPSMDSAKQVYFFGIQKKPESLKLMRTVFSDKITAERNEGDSDAGHDSRRQPHRNASRSAFESSACFQRRRPRHCSAVSGQPRPVPRKSQRSELFGFSKSRLAGVEGSLGRGGEEELGCKKRRLFEQGGAVGGRRLARADQSASLLAASALLFECLVEGCDGHPLGPVG